MKKLIALFLSLALALGCFAALAEEAPALSVDELVGLCDALLEEALSRGEVPAELNEDGFYLYDYGDFMLYSADAALTENSRLIGAEILRSGEEWSDMRGVGLGSSLDTLLSAYPLDNADLAGTYDETVLYINGMLPDTVNVGYAVRSGSHVLVVAHEIYTPNGDSAEKCSVIYTLENNQVMAIQVALDDQAWSLDEAQDYMDGLARLQETDEYSMYREATPTALAREDLRFGAIDFVSADADSLLLALGAPQSDTWEQDADGFLRVMQWADVEAVVHYNSQRQNPMLQLLHVFGESLEGPRGLHMNDTLESAMARFPHESDVGLLYGDGEHAPFGVCDVQGDSVNLVYAAQAEDAMALLEVYFVNDRLQSITCVWQ